MRALRRAAKSVGISLTRYTGTYRRRHRKKNMHTGITSSMRNLAHLTFDQSIIYMACGRFCCLLAIHIRWCFLVTFCVSRRRRIMHCGHPHLCVCLSVCLSAAACLHYCTDSGLTWRSGSGCPLVVHYLSDLKSVHRLRCYGNTMEMRGRAQR